MKVRPGIYFSGIDFAVLDINGDGLYPPTLRSTDIRTHGIDFKIDSKERLVHRLNANGDIVESKRIIVHNRYGCHFEAFRLE